MANWATWLWGRDDGSRQEEAREVRAAMREADAQANKEAHEAFMQSLDKNLSGFIKQRGGRR